MKKCMIIVGSALILLASCITLEPLYQKKHPEFTVAAQLELIEELAPEEIEKRFGPPDRVSIEMRGTKTEHPWRALVYQYVMGPSPRGVYQQIDNVNSFDFDMETKALLYWTIQLAYPVEGSTASTSREMEIIFYNGVYKGQTNHGVQNGRGTMSFNSGMTYEGEWIMGKRTGYGINRWPSGTRYEGQFSDGRPTGGLYIFSDGTSQKSYMDEKGEWHQMN